MRPPSKGGHRNQVEEVDEEPGVGQGEKQRLPGGAKRVVDRQRPHGAEQRPRQPHPGLGLDVMRQGLELDPGADERNEGRRADVEPALLGGKVVAHLVHEDQQDEADRVPPAEHQRVDEHG